MMKRIGVIAGLFVLFVASCQCEEGPKKGPKTGRMKVNENTETIPGACECALECAETTMVNDPHGLETCRSDCKAEFGKRATAKGFERALEVMGQERESCDD